MVLKWRIYMIILAFVIGSCSTDYKRGDWLAISMAPAVLFEASIDSLLEKAWFQSLIKSESLEQKVRTIYPSIQFFKEEIGVAREALGFIATNVSRLDILYLKKVDQSISDIVEQFKEEWSASNLIKLETDVVDLYELFPDTDSTQYFAIEEGTLFLSSRALAVEEAVSFIQNPPEEMPMVFQDIKGRDEVIIHAADVLWQYLIERERQIIPSIATNSYFRSNGTIPIQGQQIAEAAGFCESKMEEELLVYMPTYLLEWKMKCRYSSSVSQVLNDWMGDVFVSGEAAMKEGHFALLSKRDDSAFQAWINTLKEKGKMQEVAYGAFHITQYASGAMQLGNEDILINPFIVDFGEFVLLISSSSRATLWIDYYVLNNTFSNQVEFLQIFEKCKAESSYLSYRSNILLKKWYTEFLLGQNYRLNGILVTKNQKEKCIEFEIHPLVGERAILTPEIIWRKTFKAPIQGNIFTAEGLIIIETQESDIHFLDKNGNQKEFYLLEDSILGNIHKVDEEAENIWFHTATSLFVFTREGHLWSSFPVTLPHQVVVDATKIEFIEGQAQWFFPFGKNGVYAIDENGSVVENWTPNLKADSADLMIQFIQKPEADYVFSWTKNGWVRALSRNGEVRFERKFSTSFEYSPSIQEHQFYDRVVNIDTSNYLYVLNLLGAHFRIALSEDVDQYIFHDLFGDSRKEVIIRSGNKVKSYGYNEKNQFLLFHEYQLESSIDQIFLTGNHIGILQKQSRKIYLLDEKLDLHPSFPLEGTTPFQYIRNKDETYIIVGLGNQLIKYQLFD